MHKNVYKHVCNLCMHDASLHKYFHCDGRGAAITSWCKELTACVMDIISAMLSGPQGPVMNTTVWKCVKVNSTCLSSTPGTQKHLHACTHTHTLTPWEIDWFGIVTIWTQYIYGKYKFLFPLLYNHTFTQMYVLWLCLVRLRVRRAFRWEWGHAFAATLQ